MASYTHGMFVWRELMTNDVDASLRFFTQLVGWRVEEKMMPNGAYYLLHAGEKQVGGLMKIPEGAEMPSYWMSYVSVADVDGTMAKAQGLGAEPVWGPLDVPGVGRMGTVVDPRGCPFSVIRSTDGDPAPSVAPVQGELCWEELRTPDPAMARRFYGEVFGWAAFPRKGSALEVFGFGELPGEQAATLHAVKLGQRVGWDVFVAVDSVKDSVERTRQLSGMILSEKNELPGLGKYAVIADPTGAVTCLFHG